jgi:hypothetical protein
LAKVAGQAKGDKVQLQGMSDKQFGEIIQATEDIQYLIIKAGGMATKSRVENVLMERYDLDRSDAHEFTNRVESYNRRTWRSQWGGVVWVAGRDEPVLEDYPELTKVLA